MLETIQGFHPQVVSSSGEQRTAGGARAQMHRPRAGVTPWSGRREAGQGPWGPGWPSAADDRGPTSEKARSGGARAACPARRCPQGALSARNSEKLGNITPPLRFHCRLLKN